MNKIQRIEFEDLEFLLRQVQKPGRYTGGEWNQIKKDPEAVKLRIALAFPEAYEIGMSYLGQKILYNLLNQRSEVLAERVYAPWPDFEEQLRKSETPLFSLENRIPLFQFDIVGISLLYELNNTNLLNILELGKIPLLSQDRTLNHPLVVAGGPAALNPEPLAEFIDLFAFGDGEEVFFEIIDRYLEAKPAANSREELLRSFSNIPGLYIPYFYRTEPGKKSFLLVPRAETGFPKAIEKRIIFPMSKQQPPEKFIVPGVQTVFDRLQVEVARGCPQNCRFCQAVNLYFPYRYRPLDQTVQTVLNGLKTTGYDDLSFNALSAGDYPFLEESIDLLMPYLDRMKIAVSLPSLRPNKLSKKIVENIHSLRKTGFTLVPEAGTERLRKVINKKISDDEILKAASYAFEHGWRLIKLYFMIGLLTETAEDLEGIISLIGRVVNLGKNISGVQPAVNLSVSPFIPKPHTPFQWLPMEEEQVLIEKQHYIKNKVRRWKKVELKEHSIKTSILEAVFSRGDRRLGRVLKEAYSGGARFDGWRDLFRFDLWEKAFEKENLDYKNYLKTIDPEAELPWDIVKIGLKKSYLREELKAAEEARYTASCGEKNCASCQSCFWPEYKIGQAKPVVIQRPESLELRTEGLGKPVRYRAAYQKTGLARFLSHNDLLNQLEKAFRRSGLKLAFSSGFHPKMLISYGPALPLGMAARAEVMEFKALEVISAESFIEKMNFSLPEGLKFLDLKPCDGLCPSLFQDIINLAYSLDLSDPAIKKIDRFVEKLDKEKLLELAQDYQNKVKIQLEPATQKLWFILDFEPQKPLRIQDVVEELLGLKNSVYILTREYLIFRNGQDSRNL
ncbi:MAG: TIGR03960 family B12-binding radical SAM protein [Acidobacteriota bacterium]|nr:TIGR03960 family B12-binding radical SAM protein [Acidobacteriota bacterium]MDW3228524.1 TIGR03960 family B12-binding radical SAM protein [Acidobacteriota bacterium]